MKKRKLRLERTTIQVLSPSEMRDAGGFMQEYTPYCPSVTCVTCTTCQNCLTQNISCHLPYSNCCLIKP